jgi:hypothetical protein
MRFRSLTTLIIIAAIACDDEPGFGSAPPNCRPSEALAGTDAAPPCADFVVKIAGDPYACNFPDAGVLHRDACFAYCGRRVDTCRIFLATTPAGSPAIQCKDECPLPDAP